MILGEIIIFRGRNYDFLDFFFHPRIATVILWILPPNGMTWGWPIIQHTLYLYLYLFVLVFVFVRQLLSLWKRWTILVKYEESSTIRCTRAMSSWALFEYFFSAFLRPMKPLWFWWNMRRGAQYGEHTRAACGG